LFVEKRSLHYSAAAHLGVFLIAFFGFPSIFDRSDPEPMVMTVEVVPIGAITNLPSQDKPLSKWQQAPTPPTPKKVVPVQKEKAEPKKELPKDAVPLPEPDKKVEKKIEEPKKEDVKELPKKEEEDFDAILKSLQEQADQEAKPDAKDKKTTEENKTKSDKPYDPTVPLSISEKDAIRSQFVKCWRMPAGAKNADQLVVRVRVQVSQSGEVTEVKLASGQEGEYRGDPFFKAAADSAIRAVWKCSPLQNLPSDKFETWSDMELTFDPSEMLY
jgi:outer membrane biosynthesis protein TonB